MTKQLIGLSLDEALIGLDPANVEVVKYIDRKTDLSGEARVIRVTSDNSGKIRIVYTLFKKDVIGEKA